MEFVKKRQYQKRLIIFSFNPVHGQISIISTDYGSIFINVKENFFKDMLLDRLLQVRHSNQYTRSRKKFHTALNQVLHSIFLRIGQNITIRTMMISTV